VTTGIVKQELSDALIGRDLLKLSGVQQLADPVAPRLPGHRVLMSANTATSGRLVTAA
jgi:hypothetical protein